MSIVNESDTGPQNDHTDASQMESDPIFNISSRNHSLSPAASHTITLFDDDRVAELVYQPALLKGKNGERLWHVSEDQKCIDFCKSQLKVLHIIDFNNI